MASTNSLNDITNQLLLKYDQNFQNLYNMSDGLNKGIMNKEELITQNIIAANNKDTTINILISTIFLVIIYFVLFMANATGKLDGKKLMIICILIFLIYLFFIYFKYIRKPTDFLSKLSIAVGDQLQSSIGSLVGDRYNYTCPVDCETSGEEQDYTQIQNVPVLNKQSSENVWLYGDRSMNLYNTVPKYVNEMPYSEEQLETIVPQPFFRGISPNGATYYQCDFKVPSNSPNYNGLPMSGKKSLFTTIPCNQMSGYKETGKYICTSNDGTVKNYTSGSDSDCTKVD